MCFVAALEILESIQRQRLQQWDAKTKFTMVDLSAVDPGEGETN
ncbi:hypothetical protein [Leptothoe sp. PORK10 BA2]|nr:hypothetical protein [Leptothoe sp. PORK10 BA2]MEA5465463.1 hypothetical protein [Leptothoe sp. PORK10 BA2]